MPRRWIFCRALSVAAPGRPGDSRAHILAGLPSRDPRVGRALESAGLSLGTDLGSEGYVLHVGPREVVLAALTNTGLLHGAHSLARLVEADAGRLPRVTIRDWPLFPVRALSDDISRGQISTPEDFRSIIRRLAAWKVNVYMPYLEDMFRFERHPEIGAGRAGLTADEARDMVAYAAALGIEVIPVFQTLGHQERLLSLPAYNHLAEHPERPWCFNPADERTYGLLGELLGELAEVFPSSSLCIGCDETDGLGTGRSAQLASQIGVGGVFARHVRRVTDILGSLGKRPWMYADMLFSPGFEGGADAIPREATQVNWVYTLEEGWPRVAELARRNLPQLVSPAAHNWGRIWPDMEWARANTEGILRAGLDHAARGAVHSSWCDFDGENLREQNWHNYAHAADTMWNPDRGGRGWIDAEFCREFFGSASPALQRLHNLLAATNRDFKFYFATTAVAVWREGADAQTTRLIQDREVRARRLTRIADALDRILAKSADQVSRHRDHVDLWRLAAKRTRLLALRLQGPERVPDALRLLDELRADFERLWLRTNRRPMVDVVLAKYDSLRGRLASGRTDDGPEPGGGDAPAWAAGSGPG